MTEKEALQSAADDAPGAEARQEMNGELLHATKALLAFIADEGVTDKAFVEDGADDVTLDVWQSDEFARVIARAEAAVMQIEKNDDQAEEVK